MDKTVVRWPYCVEDGNFKIMRARAIGTYVFVVLIQLYPMIRVTGASVQNAPRFTFSAQNKEAFENGYGASG
jgi:hypothetical protein